MWLIVDFSHIKEQLFTLIEHLQICNGLIKIYLILSAIN